MTEPITITGVLGLKYSTLLGGFLGALVSLSFVAQLGWYARVSAVLTGTFTAAYATPVIVAYWAVGSAAENGIGFLLGLTSMNLIPAVMSASKWINANAGRLIARHFGVEDRQDRDNDKDKPDGGGK